MHNMLNYINNINRVEHKRDMIGYQSKNARTLTKNILLSKTKSDKNLSKLGVGKSTPL